MNTGRVNVLAPASAATLIAMQVASNACRDGLLYSSYPVTAFPYFVTIASLLAIPAAHTSGRYLARHGPAKSK